MNIPLNIDWHQIVLHLFNFMILACGLYILIYKPVKKFMRSRTEYYRQMNAKAEADSEDAEMLKSEWNLKIKNADTELTEYSRKKKEELDALLKEKEEQTKALCQKMIEDSKKQAEAEKARIIESSREEIAALAVKAVQSIMEKTEAVNIMER